MLCVCHPVPHTKSNFQWLNEIFLGYDADWLKSHVCSCIFLQYPVHNIRSRVQILLEATLHNNLRQVVHTGVPLSPSSITWYQPKGGDALRLGR